MNQKPQKTRERTILKTLKTGRKKKTVITALREDRTMQSSLIKGALESRAWNTDLKG